MHESGVRVRCRSWRSGRALLLISNGATVTSSHAGRSLFPLCPRAVLAGEASPDRLRGLIGPSSSIPVTFVISRPVSDRFRKPGAAWLPRRQSAVRNLTPGERNVFAAADGFVREAGRRMLPRPLSDGRPHACPAASGQAGRARDAPIAEIPALNRAGICP